MDNVETMTNDEQVVETVEETAEPEIEITDSLEDEPKEEKELIDNDEEHLSQYQIKQLDELLTMLAQQINTLGSIWQDTRRNYQLKDAHLKALLAFNSQHAEEKPKGYDAQQKESENPQEWDYMNGLNKLTEDDVKEIFPEENAPIYGGTFEITKGRIHDAMQEFFMWTQYKREYEHTHNAYSMLVERDEAARIAIARATALAEPDPDVRTAKLAEIDKYYEMKWIKFLREPVPEMTYKSIISALSDAPKIKYMFNRSKDKMKSLDINSKFLLMIPKFETQYLEEKYWGNQGVLLVYFMSFLTYNVFDNSQHRANSDKAKCFVIAIDRFIRNAIQNEEEKAEIINSIQMLEDQFLGKVPKATLPAEITPATEDLPELNQAAFN